ncbi:MAG: hypothetical protein ACPGWR_11385 [Ardenticatenaceae bacterium]
MRVLPLINKQGCVFYLKSTSRDACSTFNQQAGMRVLPLINKQGGVFYQVMNKQGGRASCG